MRIFSLYILILFAVANTAMALERSDSLRSIWKNTHFEDSIRFEAAFVLIDNFLPSKTDSSLYYAEQVVNQAHNKANLYYEVQALTKIGEIYFELGEKEKGERVYYKGLDMAKSINDSLIYSNKLHFLGVLYYGYQDYPNSYKVFQEAKKVCRLAGDSINEAWSIAYLGLINLKLENWSEAEMYFLEHLQISRKYNDKYGESVAKGNLGGVYENTGQLDKALEYWKAGIYIAKENGWNEYASKGTYALIRIYIKKGEYEQANKFLKEYEDVTENFPSPENEIIIHLYKCKVNYGLGHYAKALKEGEICKTLLSENKHHISGNDYEEYVKILNNSFYIIYKSLGRYQEALAYYESYHLLEEQLRKDKQRTEFQRFLFNTELVADSIEQAKEKELLNAAYTEEIRRKNLEKNSFLAVGVLVLLLALGMYHRLRYVRRSREKLNKEKERAEKSEQVKQDFLANMSHEIRTPMNAVMGMTNLVLDMPLGEKQKYYLNGIKNSSINLLHIINDILDLSKIEAGKMSLNNVDFSLRETVEQVVQMLKHRADDNEIDFFNSVEEGVNDIVMGDPFRLNQVLINLLGNAIKFTPAGSVSLEVKKINSTTQFIISDTGIGIPQDKLNSIFESFTQANSSDSKKYGGTGLGLSISQHLVALMGSTIEVESKEGTGTTFSFVIDFPEGSIERLKEISDVDLTIDGSILNGLKILIVDDNEYNIIVARDTLISKAELSIYEAKDGQEAIEMLGENSFDVILMDLQMPVMNGFDATKYIRKKLNKPIKDIPIIALTASVLKADLDKCKESGMDSFIPKPFTSHQLISTIANVLSIPIKNKKVEAIKSKEIGREESAITNLEYLYKFCENDEARVEKYISLFLSAMPQLIEKIRLALKNDDFETIANQVHGFKSKCVMMGMTVTKDLANNIEFMCRGKLNKETVVNDTEKLIQHIIKAQIELEYFIKNETM